MHTELFISSLLAWVLGAYLPSTCASSHTSTNPTPLNRLRLPHNPGPSARLGGTHRRHRQHRRNRRTCELLNDAVDRLLQPLNRPDCTA
ncbi:hypothetical protein GGR53DRAFT_99836 [Hypoxylon sp. FL1150]|nr:hypothetical protein GGR53DRAFT_99836 [Hypoxylon sp. FL1150]